MKRAVLLVILVALALALLAGCSAPREGEPYYRGEARPSSPASGRPGTAATSSVGVGGEPALDERPLTLEDCRELALRRNRRVRIGELRVLVARDAVNVALAGLLPRLQGDARYEVRNNEAESVLGPSRFQTAPRDVPMLRLQAIVPIYDFGDVWNTRTAATRRAEAAEEDLAREQQALALATAESYFTVLETKRTLDVVEQSLGALERQLVAAKDFLAQGLVAPSDVLAAEVQLSARKQERLRAANNHELAIATLNRVIGLPITNATRISEADDALPLSGNFDVVLSAAVDRRPDLGSFRREIEARQAEWRALRASFLPRLYAFGEANLVKNEFLVNEAWATGGFGATWSILEGGGKYAALKAKTKEIDQAIALHDDRVDDAILELKRAWLVATERQDEIPLTRETVRLAEENLRAVRDRYAQGLATTTDVLIEEDRLSRARATAVQALYGFHAARARLEFAAGGSIPPS